MYSGKGTVFNIQRFSTSDGPGIRTVVFLKGCPLNCAWCHNPESKNSAQEIFYKQELCIGCKSCETVCKMHNHRLENGHSFDRSGCIACGKCAKACPSHALEVRGEQKTVGEVIETVLRDKPFFDESGGGITVSGGEPLMQYDFTLSMLKSAKNYGLHTAIETSGFSDKDIVKLNRYTELWLYDIKIFSDEEHIKYTGVSNKSIFNNLHLLDSIGAKIILRCPIIPNVNMFTEHFERIAELSKNMKSVSAIHLEPYHPLGISKAEQLNKTQAYKNDEFLELSKIKPFAELLQSKTDVTVLIV